MTDYILHHFDASPFAEKIRLVFGLKGLDWYSVQIPMIMPKPDLTLLTGGYRKTPVLQIGADIHCDTSHIATVIESRDPHPTLFPGGRRGLARALSRWSDTAFFEPGAALSMGENPHVPAEVIEDRKKFFNFMDFSRLNEELPHCRTQFQAQAQLLEDELTANGPYMDGEQPGLSDIHAWFPVWMAKANIPSADSLLAPFPAVREWSDRMAQIGNGQSSAMSAKGALDIAHECAPIADNLSVNENPLGLQAGQTVSVAAADYGQDPVTGILVQLDLRTVTVSREEPRIGTVHVHFPRAGFRISTTP